MIVAYENQKVVLSLKPLLPPAVGRPNFVSFSAVVFMHKHEALQIETRARVHEVVIDKDGKLDTVHRNIRCLFPIEPGGRYRASPKGDPLHLHVTVERVG